MVNPTFNSCHIDALEKDIFGPSLGRWWMWFCQDPSPHTLLSSRVGWVDLANHLGGTAHLLCLRDKVEGPAPTQIQGVYVMCDFTHCCVQEGMGVHRRSI